MRQRIGSRLTYANVMSTLCLFILLGGGAYAALHLPRNSVKSKNIVNGQVKSPDVKDEDLRGVDVNEGTFGPVPSASQATTAEDAGTLDGIDSSGFAAAADAPLWAFVDNHPVQGGNVCTVKRSSGGIAAEQTGDGCMVDFGRDISQCGYVATLGEEVYDQTDLPGQIGVKPGNALFTTTLGPSNELILVETQSNDGSAEEAKPFYVAVFC
jgi:hypothetical protein